MNEFLEFMYNYWYLMIAGIAVISVVSIKVYLWFKQPNNKQLEQIQEWMLYAVAKAEEALGSGTGQMKLRYVYDMFLTKFPAVALFISFDDFSKMVDKALDEFEKLIAENKDISALYRLEDMRGEEE